jgi:hypothetical protein
VSESVPDTVQLPECRLPAVIRPEVETVTTPTPQGPDVVAKLTMPLGPVVASWSVNADEAVVVVVPPVGELWAMVTELTVRA